MDETEAMFLQVQIEWLEHRLAALRAEIANKTAEYDTLCERFATGWLGG